MKTGVIRCRAFTALAGRRRHAAIAASLTVAAAVGFALPGPAGAHRAAGALQKKAHLPLIRPHMGKAFVPVLGDWDGTVGGFPASFQLRFDSALRRRVGVPQYGLQHLVVLEPNACPPSSSHYAESVVGGRMPSEIGGYGSLGLSSSGFGGHFTARRSAFLTAAYHGPSCSGHLTWAMHPANRLAVDTGTWSARFADGESGRFEILAGGRLAVAIELPNALSGCSGLHGGVDLFIAPDGLAKISQPGLRVRMRFSRRSASGTMSAVQRGCPLAVIRFTASKKAG